MTRYHVTKNLDSKHLFKLSIKMYLVNTKLTRCFLLSSFKQIKYNNFRATSRSEYYSNNIT